MTGIFFEIFLDEVLISCEILVFFKWNGGGYSSFRLLEVFSGQAYFHQKDLTKFRVKQVEWMEAFFELTYSINSKKSLTVNDIH